ncbi:PP2C family protein-serine/threonine phosphatase [Litoreibacter albidus]|uniref:Protein phosphatase n=1 Tax=Litoreibacter albidus TaxID=670155 RepID=A0A1H3DCW4_9RHOB|nr:protein phosphatase 2C domain-containing protein [Litoreibacter albidus]SDX63534.1 protein phosphatase [Litoreibacter albidus]
MGTGQFIYETGAGTDTGVVRDHNEDSYLSKPDSGVWVVADGMGGHEAGDFASQAIVEKISSIGRPASAPDLQARFMERLTRAHGVIVEQSQALGGATIGATLVALLVHEELFACIWSGDSRIYLLRDGQYRQVTTDHTEVQELLNSGAITEEQAEHWPRKNVITRAIGVSSSPNTDETFGSLQAGDVFLLCSDGLTEHVEDHEMASVLASHEPQAACDALIQTTLSRGARDNVTVIVVRCNARPQDTVAGDDPLDWTQGF